MVPIPAAVDRSLPRLREIGEFWISDAGDKIVFVFPDKHADGSVSRGWADLPICAPGQACAGDHGDRVCWEWNGNRENPTLNPSVVAVVGGREQWHGWVRNGELTEA